MLYIPYVSVAMLPDIKTCLNPVTKYVNGKHLNIFNNIPSPNIFKFHIIGVNQKTNCIIIVNSCAKSGTIVHNADVNLVNAIINANAQKTIYITINKFGKYPKTDDASIAIKIKNNPIKLDDVSDIIGIISTGNTTFFTK